MIAQTDFSHLEDHLSVWFLLFRFIFRKTCIWPFDCRIKPFFSPCTFAATIITKSQQYKYKTRLLFLHIYPDFNVLTTETTFYHF